MFTFSRRPSRAILSIQGCIFAVTTVFSSCLLASENSPEQLKKIVITADLTPTPETQIGSAFTVITAKDIEKQQITYISDILRTVPGLAVNQVGGSFGSLTQVRIRGAESNQTIVRLNGIELNDPAGSSEYNFGNMLAENIERIEIIRGAQSSLYGSDAIGGVINIITKKGSQGIQLNTSIEGGSFGTYKVGGRVSGGWKDKIDFSLNATQFESKGISLSRNGTERDGSRNLTLDGNTTIRPLDNLEFGFSGRLIRSNTDTDGFSGGVGVTDADSELEVHQRFGRAFTKLSLFDEMDWLKWDHTASIAYSESKRKFFRNQSFSSRFDGRHAKYAYQTDLFVDTASIAESNHVLSFLLEHEKDTATTTFSSNNQNNIETTSYVGEYQLSLFQRLSLTGSIRYDNNDKLFRDATTFRTTASYHHSETDTRLHASYGTGSKNPTLSELFITGNFSGSEYRGNPELQPEKSNSWDIGVQQYFLDNRATLDVTYFNNRIKKFIKSVSTTEGDNLVFSFDNESGVNRIQGIEVAFQAKIMEGLDFSSSYTWNTHSNSNNTSLVRRPKHIASANLNYGFMAFGNKGNLNVGVQYNGKQTDFAFDEFFSRSIVELEDYTLLNIAASYQIVEQVELFARLENLLDEDYQEVYSYASQGIAGYGGIRMSFEPF